jgi:hypothetical protein
MRIQVLVWGWLVLKYSTGGNIFAAIDFCQEVYANFCGSLISD